MLNRFLGIATVVAGIAVALPAFAGDIAVKDAWAKESIGRAPNGAVFFTIENNGEADRIIGVTSELADRTELHTHIKKDNVMKMRRVEGGIDIPDHGSVAFKPGSYHVMFLDLHQPLGVGQHIKLTLQLEKAGNVPVDATVLSLSDAAKMDHAPMIRQMQGMGGNKGSGMGGQKGSGMGGQMQMQGNGNQTGDCAGQMQMQGTGAQTGDCVRQMKKQP
ncbi:copper chaperone PCu(A)C [uncultured Thalassospira sp.]|uniref:copper chaperone PCu(A)C n=1 Tax=uncultured Thalassospira sp. TaxID=404382 RepID=UPI0030D82C77